MHRALAEDAPVLMGVTSFDRRILYLNNAGLALTGLGTLDRARAVNFDDLLTPEGARQAREEELPAVLSGNRGVAASRWSPVRSISTRSLAERSAFSIRSWETASRSTSSSTRHRSACWSILGNSSGS